MSKINYVKVVFLKRVGAFIGSDGKAYGPYSPGDEAIIPEEDAKSLVFEGVAARIGGYTIEELKPIELKSLKEIISSPMILLMIGFTLIIIGFILMSFSAIISHGIIWIFPFPPISVTGPMLIFAIIPLIIFILFFIIFIYLMIKHL